MTKLNLVWTKPPVTLNLERDEIHVWRAALNQPAVAIDRLCSFLTSDELDRMKRYSSSTTRVRFAVGRGVLRAILSRYIRMSPEQIHFSYGFYGKPFLAMPQQEEAQSLDFNLSHSSDLALIAVAHSRKVGVDVERLQPELAYERLARRFFTPSEQRVIFAKPSGLQLYAFYQIWTRKEAFLKAKGEGLSQPMEEFEVDLLSEQGVNIVGRNHLHNLIEGWSLLPLTPGPSYVAALAVAGRDWKLSCWQWE
jgi:4'-phosphopantetheinyl transferase